MASGGYGYTHKAYEEVDLETVDPSDYKGIMRARESKIRDGWIKAMEGRLVRDELIKCYKTEGVNHYVQCHELAERYMKMIKENKVKGYRQVTPEDYK